MPRAKILCTLGPSTDPPGVIPALVAAGLDAARINFSHGGEDVQRPRIEALRAAEKAAGRPLAVIADLQGPKIRLGRFPGGPVALAQDALVTLLADGGPCDALRLTVDYPDIAHSARAGGDIFINDGLIQLRVTEIAGGEVRCRVLRGGIVSDRKGVNLPGVSINLPTLCDHDYRDALAAARLGCDAVALSFVREASDVRTLRAFLRENGSTMPIISKLERPEAVEHLDEVLRASDAVMVARGDLGVEVGVERVPVLQKRILQHARRLGRPSIVATQMLESMTTQPMPTRAEASDVANAILDGADMVMLSGETAAGRYPIEAVRTMASIAAQVAPLVMPVRGLHEGDTTDSVSEAVADGVLAMVAELPVSAIAAYTRSGDTARRLCLRRPPVPVAAFSSVERACRLCATLYGCLPHVIGEISDAESLFREAERMLLADGLAKEGDRVVIVAGLPLGASGATNLIHVRIVKG